MKHKKYLIGAAAILVSVSAIQLPGYLVNTKVSQSFGKAESVKETGKVGQVAWMQEDEAYRITSLMVSGKLDASKECVKDITVDEFLEKYPLASSKYITSKASLRQEGLYPNIYNGSSVVSDRNIKIPKVSLYHYKENIFYNYEASVWEIQIDYLDGSGLERVQIDQNLKLLKVELTLNESDTNLRLEKLHINEEQTALLLKYLDIEVFSEAEEVEVPEGNESTQRFLARIGSEGQEFFIDITSTEKIYQIQIIAK